MKESMNDLDHELTSALRREEPPAGFAGRVLDRVAAQRAAEHSRPGPQLSFLHWAAAAALVAAVAGGVDYVAKQKDRAEGEAAKDRVVLALHIAGAKLQLVQTKINQLHEQ